MYNGFLFSARAGVVHVTEEDFVSVWRLDFRTASGETAMVALPYVVEKSDDGDRHFFDPTEFCRHILLRQVTQREITLHTCITHNVIVGCKLLARM